MKYAKFVCAMCGGRHDSEGEALDCYYIHNDGTASAEVEQDVVNSPGHYRQGGIEAIDAIQASMTREEFKGYLKGNAQKYLWRYRHKGKPAEDLRKAKWYLDRLLVVLGED